MHPCRVVQSARAPGCVFVLSVMLQVQMVTPHLVHVLSQSSGSVHLRQHGDRYVRIILNANLQKKSVSLSAPNVSLIRLHRAEEKGDRSMAH